MNDKQKRFADEYLIDLNGTKAAIRAGYAENSAAVQASQMLNNEEIKKYLDQRKQEIDDELGISAYWVKKRFKEISDRCMTAEPVMIKVDGEWVESGEYQFDSSGANKATESLGKIIGVFEKDNSQSKAEPTTIINLGEGKNPSE